MIKVSIIVPVYNVEKYLPYCIESCINQTLEDIEIILVNDGSTDNSLAVWDVDIKYKKSIGFTFDDITHYIDCSLPSRLEQWVIY